MDFKKAIQDLSKQLGPPKPRASYGQWLPYAWMVRGLVEKKHGITESVNMVLEKSGVPVTKSSVGSLRASYYKIRDAEWPAEFSNKEAKKIETPEFE